jgi:hypothetical protein
MDDTIKPSPDYVKGFNEGYILTQDSRDLAEKLATAKGDGDRMQGFRDGHKEFILERIREQRERTFHKEPPSNKSKDKDFDRDR